MTEDRIVYSMDGRPIAIAKDVEIISLDNVPDEMLEAIHEMLEAIHELLEALPVDVTDMTADDADDEDGL